MSEIQLQAQIFQWAWNTWPASRYFLFAVPNGGKRGRIEANQLKASGVVAGIPDLLLIWGGRIIAFELKTEKGKLSPEQVKVHAIWQKSGVPVHIIRTFEEFKDIFTQYVS